MASLEGFKAYAVAAGDIPDAELQLFLNAAVEWFRNAGVETPTEANALYDLGVYRLATFYVDNRGPLSEGNGRESLPYGIQGIVLQLRGG